MRSKNGIITLFILAFCQPIIKALHIVRGETQGCIGIILQIIISFLWIPGISFIDKSKNEIKK